MVSNVRPPASLSSSISISLACAAVHRPTTCPRLPDEFNHTYLSTCLTSREFHPTILGFRPQVRPCLLIRAVVDLQLCIWWWAAAYHVLRRRPIGIYHHPPLRRSRHIPRPPLFTSPGLLRSVISRNHTKVPTFGQVITLACYAMITAAFSAAKSWFTNVHPWPKHPISPCCTSISLHGCLQLCLMWMSTS